MVTLAFLSDHVVYVVIDPGLVLILIPSQSEMFVKVYTTNLTVTIPATPTGALLVPVTKSSLSHCVCDCCLMMIRHANTERSHQRAPCVLLVMGLYAFNVRLLITGN